MSSRSLASTLIAALTLGLATTLTPPATGAPAPIVAARAASGIHGTLSSLAGDALGQIEVRATATDGTLTTTVTADDGTYTLTIPAGDYTVVFHDLQGRTGDNTYGNANVVKGFFRTVDFTMKLGDLRNLTHPTASGPQRAGTVMVADPGTWTAMEGTTFTYHWYIKGTHMTIGTGHTDPVTGGDTTGRLKLTGSFITLGWDKIRVAVQPYNPEWNSVAPEIVYADKSFAVHRANTSVTAKLAAKTIHRYRAALLHVNVKDNTDWTKPDGFVEVTDDRRANYGAGAQPYKTTKDGYMVLKVWPSPDLGRHRLTVRYYGDSSTTNPSTNTVTVNVTR